MSSNDELAIGQLLARSADCVWRKDADNYAKCWAQDGEWRLLGQTIKSRDAIKAAWINFNQPLRGVWQIANNLTLEFADGMAYGRIYLDETIYQPDGSVTLNRGIYHDVYKIEHGAWVFARRHIDFLYMGPPDLSGRLFTLPDYGAGSRNPHPDRPATPSLQEAFGG